MDLGAKVVIQPSSSSDDDSSNVTGHGSSTAACSAGCDLLAAIIAVTGVVSVHAAVDQVSKNLLGLIAVSNTHVKIGMKVTYPVSPAPNMYCALNDLEIDFSHVIPMEALIIPNGSPTDTPTSTLNDCSTVLLSVAEHDSVGPHVTSSKMMEIGPALVYGPLVAVKPPQSRFWMVRSLTAVGANV